MRRTALTPVFNPGQRRGSIRVGTTPGTIPEPPVCTLAILDAIAESPSSGIGAKGPTYFAMGQDDGLAFFDVDDPTSLSWVSSLIDPTNLDGLGRGMAWVGSHLAYSTSAAWFAMIDPTGPSLIGALHDTTNLGGPQAMVAGVPSADYVAMACQTSDAVTIIDISDESSPVMAGTVSDSNLDGVTGLAGYADWLAAVSPTTNKLVTIDAFDPTNPAVMTSFADADIGDPRGIAITEIVPGEPFAVIVSIGQLTCVDLTSPLSPSVLGTVIDLDIGAAPIFLNVLEGSGDTRWIAVASANVDRVGLYDVSDPTTPVLAAAIIDAGDMDGPYQAQLANIGGEPYIFTTSNVSHKIVSIGLSDCFGI